MAPTGSSIRMTVSMNTAAQQTSTPDTAPMKNAQKLDTKPQGAVIATRPASMPLTIMLGSGLPYFHHMENIEKIARDADASRVLTGVPEMRRSAPASVLPGLKANHPKARMKQPSTPIGML